MKYYEPDEEEKEIEEALEKGRLESVPNLASEKKRYQNIARYTIAKTKNINIRLSLKTLLKLKAKAIAEGLPYQTLAASILHKYALS